MDAGAQTGGDGLVILLAVAGAVVFTILPALVALLTNETPSIKPTTVGRVRLEADCRGPAACPPQLAQNNERRWEAGHYVREE